MSETLYFVHVWKPEISASFSLRDSEVFGTAHNFAVYEWQISLLREDIFALRRSNSRVMQLILEPSIRMVQERSVRACRCIFQMRVLDKDSPQRVLHLVEPHTVTPSIDDEENSVFRVPTTSKMGELLKELFHNQMYLGHFLEITTKIEIPTSSFFIGNWPMAAKPTPLHHDFRLTAVIDKSRHDLRIRCSDGVVTASREALFLSSVYFRSLLKSSNREELTEDVKKDALETVIVFMVAGTFSAPARMTNVLAAQIAEISMRYRVMNRRELLHALEQVCCMELEENCENLEETLQWLIVGCDHDMTRLQNCAYSVIINLHFNQFILDYTNETKSGVREIFERIHRRQGMFRPAPYMKLMQLYRNCSFTKKVQLSVEC